MFVAWAKSFWWSEEGQENFFWLLVRNMRTLIEAEGSIATAVARKSGRGVTVNKKSAFMMEVLRKFCMNMWKLVRQSG